MRFAAAQESLSLAELRLAEAAAPDAAVAADP
jgi:hypothetical protein